MDDNSNVMNMVGPEDSVSQIGAENRSKKNSNEKQSSSSLVTLSSRVSQASKSSSFVRMQRAQKLELANELEIIKVRHESERKQRQLQQQLIEEQEQEELRKAQLEIEHKRRQRALIEEQEKEKQRNEELELQMKYKLAKSIADICGDDYEESYSKAQSSTELDGVATPSRPFSYLPSSVPWFPVVKKDHSPTSDIINKVDKDDQIMNKSQSTAMKQQEGNPRQEGERVYMTEHKVDDSQKDCQMSIKKGDGHDRSWNSETNMVKSERRKPTTNLIITEPLVTSYQGNNKADRESTQEERAVPHEIREVQPSYRPKITRPIDDYTMQYENQPNSKQQRINVNKEQSDTCHPTSRPMDNGSPVTDILSMLVQHQLKATLPQQEIKPFDGNPMEFASFTRAFEQVIESKINSETDRIYYLDQYTNADANRIVKSCMHEKEAPYTKAKQLLKKKYGDGYKIAEAFLTKAAGWGSIKADDAKALNSYSVFLLECQNVLQGLNQAHELDHTINLKTVISKLPYKLRDKWRTRVDQLMEAGKVIKFSHVVAFVEIQARIASNHYGDLLVRNDKDESHKKWSSDKPRHKVRSFATSTGATTKSEYGQKQEKSCVYCDKTNHELENCFKLQNKPIDQRLSYLKKEGICFGCLKRAKHHRKDCTRKLTCSKCNRNHPIVLHEERTNNTQQSASSASKAPGSNTERKNENGVESSTCARTQYKSTGAGERKEDSGPSPCIIPVTITSKATGAAVTTLAYMDEGSDAVFCSDEVRQQLGMRGKKTKLKLKTMTDEASVDTSILTGLAVCSVDRKYSVPLPCVYAQKSIPANAEDMITQEEIQKWDYLHGVHMNEKPDGISVGLLIGNNVPEVFEPWDVINSQNGGPYACKTILGWTVHGVKGVKKTHTTSARILVGDRASHDLGKQLVDMYNRDFPERAAEDIPEDSQEDRCFLELVEKSIKHKDGFYEIGLPLKSSMNEEPHHEIPNNKAQAEQRLRHLKRKFQQDINFHKEYKTFMEETIDNGHAALVPEEELKAERTWYLPHHGVRHPKKNKIRVVFDCSAKYKGFCLNSELLQGPNLSNTLIGVLIRFRQSPVAVVADIKAMFHQVKVPKSDQDLIRFLWWRDGNIERPVEEYRMGVHLFGATSSPACASFALKRAIEESKPTNGDKLTSVMQQSFYVDDSLVSTETEKEAVSLVESLRRSCQNGGFRLTKWLSNNRNVLNTIPVEERASGVRSLDLEDGTLPTERALGVLWSSETDTFGFQISLPDKPATRRGILSVVSSLYDPLGFVGPAMLPAKGLLQDLCREKLDWDDEIPKKYLITWQEWLHDVPSLMDLKINRCLRPREFKFNQPKSVELHHFSDASDQGYGTASYLRITNRDEEVHCTLLFGKARVAPLKKTTIPRLELTAATVAVRVNSMIGKELQIRVDRTVFWTDSLTVLRYINNQSTRFHTFVANRLSVIHDGSSPSQWRYVNTKDNPADDSSRGMTVKKFLQQARWFNGPDFLWQNEDSWPVDPECIHAKPTDEDPEIKHKEVNVSRTAVKCEEAMERLLHYFHSWFKLKKAVAWLLRFKTILLHKTRQKVEERANIQPLQQKGKKDGEQNEDHKETAKDRGQVNNNDQNAQNKVQSKHKTKSTTSEKPQLSMKDMQEAEAAIIGYIQKQAYREEINHLTRKSSTKNTNRQQKYVGVKKSSSIYKLDPVYTSSLLRVGGRLNKSALPEEAKHPVILPKNSNVTKLILGDIHEKLGHGGRNHMLSCAQKKYWIMKANAAARNVINSCIVCRKNRAKVGGQKMANLPESRLKPEEPPFTRVGIDYFGPIEVKRGRCDIKRYGVLFTCFATRAVHIEKADSLDTDSCINAFRRFIARRGQVREMTSDNGSNLVGAEKELKREINRWNTTQIHEEMLQSNIDWHFNPPAGSNFGGVWERHIRTVRKLMCSMLKEQTITDESLQTLFCEIEAVMNSRPICRVSGDPNDLEALTPNHLLLMKSNPMLPPVLAEQTGPYARRRWRQIQYLAELFWKRWLKEYVPMLQERQKWLRPETNLKIGDVVLIADSSKPRNTWNLGRVVKTLPDETGLVRQVEVKTKTTILRRPVNKLCLLLEADE